MARKGSNSEPSARPKSTRNVSKPIRLRDYEETGTNKRVVPAQRRARAPSIHTDEEPLPEQPEASSRGSTPSEVDFDVSIIEYKLNIKAFLGKDEAMTRIRTFTLDKFKLQPFLAESIKTVALKLEKETNLLKWVGGRAELRHKGLKKVADYSRNDVLDADDWREVEKVLLSWMLKKHKDIRVDLVINYKEVLHVVPERNEPAPLPRAAEALSQASTRNGVLF